MSPSRVSGEVRSRPTGKESKRKGVSMRRAFFSLLALAVAMLQKIQQTQQLNPKDRLKKIQELLHEKPSAGPATVLYLVGLQSATSEQEARKLVEDWTELARQHGDAYANEVRVQAVRVLG